CYVLSLFVLSFFFFFFSSRRRHTRFSRDWSSDVCFPICACVLISQIINGLLTLDPELQLVGPSGAFKINGTTDMASEDLNMRLVMVLPVTQNLPLAAILMGASAPIGGALFVLDKDRKSTRLNSSHVKIS